MSDVLARAAEVLVWHQRTGPATCVCGPMPLGSSHPAHQAQMLADAGLLAGDDPHAGHRWARAMCPACEEAEDAKAESAPVAGGNGAVGAQDGEPR